MEDNTIPYYNCSACGGRHKAFSTCVPRIPTMADMQAHWDRMNKAQLPPQPSQPPEYIAPKRHWRRMGGQRSILVDDATDRVVGTVQSGSDQLWTAVLYRSPTPLGDFASEEGAKRAVERALADASKIKWVDA